MSELADFLETIKTGGAALVPFLGWLYWRELTDRKAAEADLRAITKETIEAIKENQLTVAKLADGAETTRDILSSIREAIALLQQMLQTQQRRSR